MKIPVILVTIFVIVFSILLMGCQKKQLTFTLENYPRVDGSTVTIPLSEAIASKLTGQALEEVRPYILHNKTHQAYVNLYYQLAEESGYVKIE